MDAVQGQKEVVQASQKDGTTRHRSDKIDWLLGALMCKYLWGACY